VGYTKTIFLMSLIVFLFGFFGFLIGGEAGMVIALVFAAIGNVTAYWHSDKMVLKYYSATLVDKNSSPELVNSVKEIAAKAGIPAPKTYIIEEEAPNAFATGRNPENAAVAVTRGLLRTLTMRELKGVLAHEIAHIVKRDILISTVSATFAGAISSLATFAMFFGGRGGARGFNPVFAILLAVLAPLAASLIQMAISRSREFEADFNGATYCGDPEALASALAKIDNMARKTIFEKAENRPETAQMMIMSPLSSNGVKNLFSTHPTTHERILRLKNLANTTR